MTTKEAIEAIYQGNLSPSPSALALLAAYARIDDEPLWASVCRPFGSSDTVAHLEIHRLELQDSLAALHPFAQDVPPITWLHAGDGVNREAAEHLLRLRSKAEVIGGDAQKEFDIYDEQQKAVLTRISADLKADAKALDDLHKSPAGKKSVSLSDVSGIARNTGTLVRNLKGPLNLDEADSQTVENAASLAETLIGTAIQIGAGNYFAAVVAFSSALSLAGNKSKGPAADSPEVKMLKDLRKTLDRIVDTLAKLQEEARQTFLQIDRLDEHILYVRDLVVASGEGDKLAQCDSFLQTRKTYSFGLRGFTSVIEAEKHCMEMSNALRGGKDVLERVFSKSVFRVSESPFHALFFRQTVEGKKEVGETLQTAGRQRTQVYEPLLKFMQDKCSRDNLDMQSYLECLLKPSGSLSDLQTKTGRARSGDLGKDFTQWHAEVARGIPLEKSLSEALEPGTIDLCTSFLIPFLPYWEWVKNDATGQFYSPADWSGSTLERRNLPRTLLLWALHLVDIGLAQQNLLSGDVVLSWLAKDWKPLQKKAQLRDPLTIRPIIGGTKEQRGTLCQATAMTANPVLAQNYLLYLLKKQGARVDTNAYRAALASSSKSFLDRLFRPTEDATFPCEFELLPESKQGPGTSSAGPGWAVKLEVMRKDQPDDLGEPTGLTIYQNLPSLLDFHHGRLRQTEALNFLAVRRAEILDHLGGYRFTPGANRQQYYSFMMLGGRLG